MILIVKPVQPMFRIAAIFIAIGVLSACGQRGPLFFPNKPDVAVPTPATPSPVPTASNTPVAK